MNKFRHPGHLIGLALIILAATVTLISCEDFFGAENLKQIIKEDVAAANAAEVTVVLRSERDSMGVPNPLGETQFKLNVPYSITTTTASDYIFIEWSHNGEAGDIEFENSNAISTKVIIKNNKDNLRITPLFDERLRPILWDPYTIQEKVVTDIATTILFNKVVDPSSVILGSEGSIQIVSGSFKRDPVTQLKPPLLSIEEKFEVSVVDKQIQLILKPGMFLDTYSDVIISLLSEIVDLDGHSMARDYSGQFKTGSGVDDEAPTIQLYTISSTNGLIFTESNTQLFSNNMLININVSAEDLSQEVWDMEIRETPCDSTGTPTGTPIIHSFGYYTSQPLTLASVEDGWTKLQVLVADTSGNWTTDNETSTNTKLVYLDTTAPFIVDFPLPLVTNTSGQAISITASDAGSGIATYAISGLGVATGSGYSGSGQDTSFTLQDSDGTKTVTLTVTDNVGWSTSTTKSTILDRAPPVINLGTFVSNNTTNTSFATAEDQVYLSFTPVDANLSPTAIVTLADLAPQTVNVISGSPIVVSPPSLFGVDNGLINWSITVSDLGGNSTTVNSTDAGVAGITGTVTVNNVNASVWLSKDHADNIVRDADTVRITATFFSEYEINENPAPEISIGNIITNAVMLRSESRNDIWYYNWDVPSGSNYDGEVAVTISATDVAGIPCLPAMGDTRYTIDNTAPTTHIGSPSANYVKDDGSITYTVNYNELDMSEITLTEADIELLTTGSATASNVSVSGTGLSQRTITLSGFSGDGTIGIRIPAGTAVDVAGNLALAAVDSTTFIVDNTRPTVSIGTPSLTHARNATEVQYTITYADTFLSGITLTASDITLNRTGTANGTVSVSGTGLGPRTVTISGITGDGTIGITTAAGTAIDLAGNLVLVSSEPTTFIADNTRPTVNISAPSLEQAKNGTSITYTVTYADTYLSGITLTASDITLNRTGTANGTVSVSGTGLGPRTVTISGITGDGTIGITTATGTATDLAGNQVLASAGSATFIADNTRPTVSINTPSLEQAKNGTEVTYIVTYTDTYLSGITLTASDITLNTTGSANGTISVSGTELGPRTVTISGITGDGTIGITTAA